MYTVIFLDDEAITLRLLENAIDWQKHNVQIVGTARNGEDGLVLFKQVKPDIIIADIRMPKLNGIDFMEEVRRSNQKVKLILFSAYAEFEYAHKAIAIQISAYLLKPLNEKELDELIGRIVGELQSDEAEPVALEQEEQELAKNGTKHYIVNKARIYTEKHFEESALTLQVVSDHVSLSKNHFSTLFHQVTGQKYWDYLTNLRVSKAKELLMNEVKSVFEIAFMVGYESESHFCKQFKKVTGLTPREFRNG